MTVTAADQDGDPITSLTADLSGLPAGSAATFVPGPGNTTGTLTWTPVLTDARSTPYSVTFTAANDRTGSAATAITVTNRNLVTNPSFETSTSGWGTYLGSTLARVAVGHDGAYSLAVRGPATPSMFGVNDAPDWVNPVAAVGTRYRYTAWVRSDSATGSAQLQIREFIGGVQRGSTVRSPAVTLSRTWQMVIADYVATTAGTSLNLQIVDTPVASGEAFQVDEVSIVVVPGAAANVGTEAPRDGLDAAADRPLAVGPIRATVSPNPLATVGSLSFTTARAGFVRVQVFDVRGRSVRNLVDAPNQPAGRHAFALDGRDDAGARLPPGVYCYRVLTPENATTGRFLVVR